MNTISADLQLPAAGRGRFPAGRWLHAAFAMLERAHQRRRQRRALAGLDARLLRDVGISAAQARCEAAKPFWRD